MWKGGLYFNTHLVSKFSSFVVFLSYISFWGEGIDLDL